MKKSNDHFKNLQHLLLLLQRHRIRLTPPIVQAVRREPVQLVAAHSDLMQRARHAELADDRIKDVAQIRSGDVHGPLAQQLRHDGLGEEEVAHAGLTVVVGVVAGVEFAYGRKEDAACFAVADAEGAELSHKHTISASFLQ